MKNLLHNRQGTNQFQAKRALFTPQPMWKLTRANWKDIAVIGAVAFIVTIIAVEYHVDLRRSHVNDSLNWVKKADASMPRPTPEAQTSEQQAIIDEINRVFGDDAPKAFKLLSCENHALNPRAVNTNTDSIQSKDYGVFQINNHWQSVTNVAFLTDYKVNIAMAYNIYSRDGHTFKLWTCGRNLGI